MRHTFSLIWLIGISGDLIHLGSILEAAQRHIHSSTHLFKLAQDAFRYAELPPSQSTPGENSSIELGQHHPHDHKALLNVAFQLGLQVCQRVSVSFGLWCDQIPKHFVDHSCFTKLEVLIFLRVKMSECCDVMWSKIGHLSARWGVVERLESVLF